MVATLIFRHFKMLYKDATCYYRYFVIIKDY